jgi:hypothetical protein
VNTIENSWKLFYFSILWKKRRNTVSRTIPATTYRAKKLTRWNSSGALNPISMYESNYHNYWENCISGMQNWSKFLDELQNNKTLTIFAQQCWTWAINSLNHKWSVISVSSRLGTSDKYPQHPISLASFPRASDQQWFLSFNIWFAQQIFVEINIRCKLSLFCSTF